jgi:hypothetical protein
MGFNKRYIGLDTIKAYMKNDGVASLKKLFSEKIDVFIFTDTLSHEIYEMYLNGETRKIECLIRPE